MVSMPPSTGRATRRQCADALETAWATAAFSLHLDPHLAKEDGHAYGLIKERVLTDQLMLVGVMGRAKFAGSYRGHRVDVPTSERRRPREHDRVWQMVMPAEVFGGAIQLVDQAIGDDFAGTRSTHPDLTSEPETSADAALSVSAATAGSSRGPIMSAAEHVGAEDTRPSWQGINHLTLVTTDMDATVRFYHGTLGARLVATIRTPEFRHYFFEFGPQCTVAFFEYAETPAQPFVNRGRRAQRTRPTVRPSVH